ncbi:hypothetical protein ACFW96_35905, partial [Streptomyces gardneri]
MTEETPGFEEKSDVPSGATPDDAAEARGAPHKNGARPPPGAPHRQESAHTPPAPPPTTTDSRAP